MPTSANGGANSSEVSFTRPGRLRQLLGKDSGSESALTFSITASIREGSVPRKPKIACFWSPTQTLRFAMDASLRKIASWMGLVSWNSSTSTRSSSCDSLSLTSGRSSSSRAYISWSGKSITPCVCL
ncbi:MAG: hypothetical protein BWX71_00606 [Deltaproteobacteria bacterium ADurb.Bin072]|nr:MAG: hypothetical protein BWX71_00606 [Deltaproteobacteria bacterium ADurb.Bin072]